MTYSAGNTILAADLNSMIADVEDIFGDNNSASTAAGALIFGYGESMLQADVSGGNTITAAQKQNLLPFKYSLISLIKTIIATGIGK